MLPLGCGEGAEFVKRIVRWTCDHGVHGDLRYCPVPELVALDLPGGRGFVDALQAIWDTGDAAAPLDPRLPAEARRVVLDALKPTRIVSSDGEQHALSGGVPVEEGDALVVATSGTSQRPRGVVLTHDAVLASAQATSKRLDMDPSKHTWLACLPLAHIGGLAVVTRAVLTSTPVIVMPGFEAETVEQLGRSRRVTHVSLVATALNRLDPSVFTCVLLGGSAAPTNVPENVVPTYGMTETGSGVVYGGVPLDAVEVAIRDMPAEEADPRPEEGEILVRAPMLLRCYRDGGDGRVVGPDGDRSWFATGDAGRLDSRGVLTVSGRLGDVITTGGEKVWPALVERVLIAHRKVSDVAVWKRTDPDWGERVVAWVVPVDEGPSLEELREMVTETLSPWAAPKELVIIDNLPRSPAGKVMRRRLLDSKGHPPASGD
jgi:O-succinylbenzoic acid--CoA ligase